MVDIKVNLCELDVKGVDWISLAQVTDRWRTLKDR
jgi:hypothetical protein